LDATQSIYEDEFFGKSSILRKRFEIIIETKKSIGFIKYIDKIPRLFRRWGMLPFTKSKTSLKI